MSTQNNIATTPADWRGEPIYRVPSACRDSRNTYRVFHRDIEGRVVAEFYGPRAREMAERFCEMFGEPSGVKVWVGQHVRSCWARVGENMTDESIRQDLHAAVMSVFGGLGAISPKLYEHALLRVAKLCGRVVDDELRQDVEAQLRQMPCPLD